MTAPVGQNDRKWVVAAYRRIRKDNRAYSLDELLAAIPGPAGRSHGELGDMLDKVVAFRRLKKAPPRWDLAGAVQVKPAAAFPDSPAALPAAAAQPLAAPTSLPKQRTPRPRFAFGPWRTGSGQLNSGTPLDHTWPELLRAVTDALSDGYVDRLALKLGLKAPNIPMRVAALRGLDPIPFSYGGRAV